MHPLPLTLAEQIGQIMAIYGLGEFLLIGGWSLLLQMIEAREDVRLKAIDSGLLFGGAGVVHMVIGGVLYRLF